MKISFGNMTVELNIFHISKQVLDNEDICEVDMIESLVHDTFLQSNYEDPLEACLNLFGCKFDIEHSIEEVNALLDSVPLLSTDGWQPKVTPLPLSSSPPPFAVEPPKLELKPLPDTLKYAFLGSSETLPIIIASDLDDLRERQLISVLQEHKEAIGWSIADIKGISLSVVMHRIHLEENAKTSREPQRRLNPIMQEKV